MVLKPSGNDVVTAVFYWPVMLIDLAIIVAVPLSLFTTLISEDRLILAYKVVGGLAAVVFILTIFDGKTRRAVNDYNEQAKARSKSRNWFQNLFVRIGDGRLHLCVFILWLELMALLFTSRQTAQILLFAGFFLTGSLLLRTLKTKGSWLDDKRL